MCDTNMEIELIGGPRDGEVRAFRKSGQSVWRDPATGQFTSKISIPRDDNRDLYDWYGIDPGSMKGSYIGTRHWLQEEPN